MKLALAFDKKAKIRYLAGLEPRKKETPGFCCNIRKPTSCDNRWRQAIGACPVRFILSTLTNRRPTKV